MSLTIESTTSPESADLIRNFLNGRYSGVLATADAVGIPHAAVVYFTLDGDFSLTFGTKTETQKHKNIEENKQVAFVVYDEVEQSVVQITGRVEVVEDEGKKQSIFSNMSRSSAERSQTALPPAEKLWAGEYIAMRIVPNVIKMTIYARPNSDDEDLFETILFSE